HSSYLTFRGRETMRVIGAASHWETVADSGHVKTHAFCPRCGTPVYLTFGSMPELVAVHAGALDEPKAFVPGVVTYGRSGLAWDTVDPELSVFSTRPR